MSYDLHGPRWKKLKLKKATAHTLLCKIEQELKETCILGIKLHENEQESRFIVKYDVFDKIIKK